MPSPRPPYLPGHFYHFYNRGRSRLPIFREEDNYRFVLRKLQHYLPLLELSMVAFCLLPNHYHFLVRQDGQPHAGLLPQRVFNSYSKAYNKRYWHSGTLFEGSYKVKPVADSTYLLQLCRYIHANPVRHGLVSDPADWPYSNYLAWIAPPNQGQPEVTLRGHFSLSPSQYRDFVLDDLSAALPTWPA